MNADIQYKKRKHPVSFSFVIFVLFVIAMGGLASYFFYDSQKYKKELNNILNKEEIILKELSEIVLLPEETPNIQRIGNLNRSVQENEFFKNASSSDYVIIFEQDRKILIYSPEQNKIIEWGNLFLNSKQ